MFSNISVSWWNRFNQKWDTGLSTSMQLDRKWCFHLKIFKVCNMLVNSNLCFDSLMTTDLGKVRTKGRFSSAVWMYTLLTVTSNKGVPVASWLLYKAIYVNVIWLVSQLLRYCIVVHIAGEYKQRQIIKNDAWYTKS